MVGHPGHAEQQDFLPRLIAWEVTRFCVLACKHCRGAARAEAYAGELTTQECFSVLDNIASFARPIIILTGGEPMSRPDIYDIAAHAHGLGLPVVMAPCGMLIDDQTAAKIVQSGIKRISISLDGAAAESHDAFRGVEGAFEATIRGLEAAKRAGISFQINTTVTKHNLTELPAIRKLAIKLGASVFNPFFLVPTGRGKDLADQEISPQEYEKTLAWLADLQNSPEIEMRITCAPHYQRILRQRHTSGSHPVKGCMGGQSFAFISHRGKVQICGFLDIPCGDLRHAGLDFRKIWETSEVFRHVRQVDSYQGRCGYCEFRKVCGGCRARAYAMNGDYLAEEPFCLHQPRNRHGEDKGSDSPAGLDELDKKILSVIQADLPVAPRPFDLVAERLSVNCEEVLARIARMCSSGVIRRLGPVFDSARLGYTSTLVAARIPPQRLNEVAQLVSALPGVTHNYARQHEFNLWFTLTAESPEQIVNIVQQLHKQTGIPDFYSLPALAVYKIRVDFPLAEVASADSTVNPFQQPKYSGGPVELDGQQKELVRLLQAGLPVEHEPFAGMAGKLGGGAADIMQQIQQWLDAGVIRRFGAVVQHRQLGFKANGMAVFQVTEDRVETVGKRLAQQPEISHCYRRPRLRDWPYDLYAMVHGPSEEQVRRLVERLAAELAIEQYDVLFSTTEYKKTSMKYFMETAKR